MMEKGVGISSSLPCYHEMEIEFFFIDIQIMKISLNIGILHRVIEDFFVVFLVFLC